MNVVGAKWWKFDFHTHTPASFDYGKGDKSIKEKSPRDWLLDFVEQGVECVAVTDHNSGEWIDSLKSEAEKLRDEGKTIFVFPGVEITANGNIHILGIFDPQNTTSDISAIIGAVRFRGTKGDSDSVAEESAENVIREIKEAGGIAIPAHIDMKAGLCEQPSIHTIKQVCENANAVEVIFPDRECDVAPLSRFSNLNLQIPSIIGSDAHKPRDIDRAFTWVKMANPSINGLKLALIDGSSSIIRSDAISENPNKASSTILQSVSIENSKYAGRPSKLKIRFNPWLNSIIGGRGSGKSSVLEFIRLGMDRGRDLLTLPTENEVRKTFESFIKVSDSRHAEGVMLDDTVIRCVYTKEKTHYRLTWEKASGEVKIERYDSNNWIPEEGQAYSRFPVKIFSQKQIFDLAKNPNTLLRLIDESSAVSSQQWNMEWSEKYSHFMTLCSERRELQAKLSNKSTLLGQKSDVEQKIKVIEESGHKKILEDFQNFRKSKSAVSNYIEEINRYQGKIKDFIHESNPFTVDPSYLNMSDASENALFGELSKLIHSAENSRESIVKILDALNAEQQKFQLWLEQSDFIKAGNDVEAEYQSLISRLQNEGVDNPSEYESLIEQKEKINEMLNSLSQVEQAIESKSQLINSSYLELIDCRKRLTLERLKFIENNLSENSAIKISIVPFSDIREMEDSFRTAIGRTDSVFSAEILDQDREGGFLFKLNEALERLENPSHLTSIDTALSIIHEFKHSVFGFRNGEIFSSKIGKRFMSFMEEIDSHNWDAINAWFPEDKLSIQFQDTKGYKDVAQGSAGQKASAVLSFLLSYGTEPLILDQPEDDLDNGLITNLIVSKLHENKSNRQIIVVTHNPNIVVNGDSDYVIALESRGQISNLASGALQDIDVRRNVCEIMEGGEAALQKRYKRMFNI